MKNYFRMFEWLLLAVIFYACAMLVTQPQIQTLLWKLGHVTVGAFCGYWIDRKVLGRVDHLDTNGSRQIARAVIILAAVYGIAGGL